MDHLDHKQYLENFQIQSENKLQEIQGLKRAMVSSQDFEGAAAIRQAEEKLKSLIDTLDTITRLSRKRKRGELIHSIFEEAGKLGEN